MEDVIDIGAKPAAGSEIADITFDNASASPFLQSDFRANFVEVPLVTGAKIIETENVLVEPEECFEDVRADESGNAGDEPGAGSGAKSRL